MTTQLYPDFPTRRFQSAAAHYVPGRPPYPPALIARVAERLGIGPGDRLLDLGCGPANLALAFAPYAGEVLALDPEPAMLALAAASARAVPNVHVQAGCAADLSAGFGQFQAALIGRAFHWMDRADTLQRLDTILARDGAVVLFDDEHPDIPQNAWRRGFADVIARYAADDEDRQRRTSAAYIPHMSVLLGSAFARIETVGVVVRQAVSAEVVLARALSLSSTSEARLGARAADLVAELRAATAGWRDAHPEEIIEWTAILALRPDA